MAGRIRSIKPEILDDERSAGLSDAAWRLWVSMWLLADDFGRLRGSPVWLEGQVFWGREEANRPALVALLVELRRALVIIPYEVEGQAYFQVRNWKKHQKVDKPGAPRVPIPTDEQILEGIESARSLDQLASHSRAVRESFANDQDLRSGSGSGSLTPTPTADQPRLPPPRGHQQSLLVEEPPKDLPKRKTSQKRGEFEPSEGGRRVLDELNRRRMRSVGGAKELSGNRVNLEEIEARLAEGHSVEELEHVCAVAEGKYLRDKASQYFNATTPFRSGNIARYLAEPKPEIRVARSLPAPAPGSEPMRFGMDDHFEQIKHRLPTADETYAALLELEAEEGDDHA